MFMRNDVVGIDEAGMLAFINSRCSSHGGKKYKPTLSLGVIPSIYETEILLWYPLGGAASRNSHHTANMIRQKGANCVV